MSYVFRSSRQQGARQEAEPSADEKCGASKSIAGEVTQNSDPRTAPPTNQRFAQEDAQLISQVAAGDEDAVVVLLERYSSYVFNVALAILKDRGEAQDVVQQTFFELCRTATQFNAARGSFPAWVLRIASHAALKRKNYLRARPAYTALQIEEVETESLGGTNDLDLAGQERMHLVGELLAHLKPAQRRAIELKFFEGLSADQAAIRTGESPSSFENNLYRGLKKLQDLIRRKQRTTTR